MNQPPATEILGVGNAVIIKSITVIAYRADKLLIKNRYEIVVDIDVLVHPTHQAANAFVFHTDGFHSLENLPSFYRILLVIIIREGFGEVGR